MMVGQIFSLLMLSNVLKMTTALEKKAAKTEMETEASEMAKVEIETSAMAKVEMEAKALLQKEWAEPLTNVLKRAEKSAKTMQVSEALQVVGHKMIAEVTGFLQGQNTTQEVNPHSFAATTRSSELSKPTVFDR